MAVAFDAVARFTVNPPAGAGSVNCTVLCVCAPGAPPMLLGSPRALPRTVTVDSPVANPSACALSRLVPSARPVTSKLALCCPAGISTLVGARSTVLSELPRVTVRPPVGAACGAFTLITAGRCTPMVGAVGASSSAGKLTTSTKAAAEPRVAWLAVMEVVPTALACTSTSAPYWPAATVAREATVATEGTLLVRSMPRPPAGAGALTARRKIATTPGLSLRRVGSSDSGD